MTGAEPEDTPFTHLRGFLVHVLYGSGQDLAKRDVRLFLPQLNVRREHLQTNGNNTSKSALVEKRFACAKTEGQKRLHDRTKAIRRHSAM